MDAKKNVELRVSIEAQPEMRNGVYANFVSIQSNDVDCILNFCFLDGQSDDGSMSGVLTSRVIMHNSQLLELRDAIDRHIIASASTDGGNSHER